MICKQPIIIKRVLRVLGKCFLSETFEVIFRDHFPIENVFSVNYVTQNGGGVQYFNSFEEHGGVIYKNFKTFNFQS